MTIPEVLVIILTVVGCFAVGFWFHYLAVNEIGAFGRFLHRHGFDETDFYS